jgi:hypothetical protein
MQLKHINKLNTKKNNQIFGIVLSFLTFLFIFFIDLNFFKDNYFLYLIPLFFFITSLIAPYIYKYPCLVWLIFGDLLSKIVSPIFLLLIFSILFVPFSVFFRLIGRDVLNIFKPNEKYSYWIKRSKQPENIENQF